MTSIKPRLDLFPYRANISPVAFATLATGAARSTRTSRASTYAPVRVPTPFPFRVSISHSNDTTAPFRTVFGTVSEIILQNTVVVAFPRASHIASRAWTSTNVSVLPILATRVTVPVALSPVSRASALVDARVARRPRLGRGRARFPTETRDETRSPAGETRVIVSRVPVPSRNDSAQRDACMVSDARATRGRRARRRGRGRGNRPRRDARVSSARREARAGGRDGERTTARVCFRTRCPRRRARMTDRERPVSRAASQGNTPTVTHAHSRRDGRFDDSRADDGQGVGKPFVFEPGRDEPPGVHG